jgi:RNA polymerase sigma-70 factor (ECF subfamily)
MSERLEESTDFELLERVIRGEEQCFEILIKRHQNRVASVVINMIGPGLEADEIGQDVFVKLYQKASQFNQEASLGTYLTKIAINLCLNKLKRRQWYVSKFFSTDEAHQLSQPSTSYSNEDKEWLQYALRQVKPDFRSVIVLRMIDGYSTKETAALLSISEGTVMSRLSRGMKNLKSILEKMKHNGE